MQDYPIVQEKSEETVSSRMQLTLLQFRGRAIIRWLLPCFMISYACVGSRSAQLLDDTEGSVQRLRLKQHGLRFPSLSFEQATSIRR